jgi:hypothetical protein
MFGERDPTMVTRCARHLSQCCRGVLEAKLKMKTRHNLQTRQNQRQKRARFLLTEVLFVVFEHQKT